MILLEPRRSCGAALPAPEPNRIKQKGGIGCGHRRSLDRLASGCAEVQQCLSLSMAHAVTNQHKCSFFTTLNEDVLEKLWEWAAAELKAAASQTTPAGSGQFRSQQPEAGGIA